MRPGVARAGIWARLTPLGSKPFTPAPAGLFFAGYRAKGHDLG
jgi:hypothetical protein